MGKRKPQQSKKNKALRKQRNIARQEARLARKKLKKEIEKNHPKSLQEKPILNPSKPLPEKAITQLQSVPEWITSNLSIEEHSFLSSKKYRVYRINTSKENIGYFGVYHSGCFNYAIVADNISAEQVLALIKKYIRKTLHLNPVENPRLYHPKDD